MGQEREVKIKVTAEDGVEPGITKAQKSLGALQQRADEESFRARQRGLRNNGDDFLAEAEKIARDHHKQSSRLEAERQAALTAVGDDPTARAAVEEAHAQRQLAADHEAAVAQQALLKADAAAKEAIERESAQKRQAIQEKEEAAALAIQERGEAQRRAALRKDRQAEAAIQKEAIDRAIAREAEAAEKSAQMMRSRGGRGGRGGSGGGGGRGGSGGEPEQKDGLKGLKQQFGEDSDFGLVMKTIRGAGAVAGVAVGASVLADMAAGVNRLSEGTKNGTLSATQIRNAFEESIPVVGRLASEIDELFTGGRSADKAKEMVRTFAAAAHEAQLQADQQATALRTRGTERQRAEMEAAQRSEKAAVARELNTAVAGADPEERARARIAAGDKVAALDRKHAAERAELERAAEEQEEQDQLAHDQRLIGLHAQKDAGWAADRGRMLDAQLLQVKAKYDAAAKSIEAEEKARLAADPSRGSEIQLRAQQIQIANEELRAAEEARVRQQFQDEEAEQLRQHNSRVADMRGENQQLELKAVGRGYDAQVEALRRAKQKELEEIQHALDEKLKLYQKDPDRTNETEAVRRAAELRQQVETKYRLAAEAGEDADKNRRSDRAQDLSSRLTQIRLDGLQQEAAAGDVAKQRDAEKLQIAEQFRQKREALVKTLRDERDLTDEQKKAILDSLGGLAQQEAVAQRLAEIHGNDPGLKPPPGLTTSRFGNAGYDDRFQRRADDLKDVVKNTKNSVDTQREIAGYLRDIWYSRPELVPLFTGRP